MSDARPSIDILFFFLFCLCLIPASYGISLRGDTSTGSPILSDSLPPPLPPPLLAELQTSQSQEHEKFKLPSLKSIKSLAGKAMSFLTKPAYDPMKSSRLDYAEDARQRVIRMKFERQGIYQRYSPELFLGPNIKDGQKNDNTPIAPPFADPFGATEGPVLSSASQLYKIPNTYAVRRLPIPYTDAMPVPSSGLAHPPFLLNPQSAPIGLGKPPSTNSERVQSIKDFLNRGGTSNVASPFTAQPKLRPAPQPTAQTKPEKTNKTEEPEE